jgi:hypothetical protein
MKKLLWLLIAGSMSLLVHAQSPTGALCQQVIVPTEEQSTSDYRRMQSFMSTNSSYEYERLKKLDTSARGAQASYKVFSAEYNDSNTKEDFSEKVRQRLSNESFNLSESDARSYAKTGLTDFQVAAWQECVQRVTGAGGLLLSAKNMTSSGFTLVVARVFQPGVGQGAVEFEIVGGSIGSKKLIQETYVGFGSKAYEVKRDSSAQAVRVSGTLMSTFPDSVLVDYTPRVITKPPPFEKRFQASAISPEGYVEFDSAQSMIASYSPGGGPAENFSVEVDMPRAGTYRVEAMWAAATATEVHVYTKPVSKSCTDPNMNMDDAAVHYQPSVAGGWTRANLPPYPDTVGNLLLRAGKTKITFTSRACGNGVGGGRLPSTAWVQFREL